MTLTAPGNDSHSLPDGTPCACTPAGGVDVGRWNAQHSACWNRWRTWLASVVPGLEFIRGVEVQLRGALHDHAIVSSPVPLPLKRWRPVMRAHAIAAGYGHGLDVTEVVPGSRKAAYYISKYITKACDVREFVPWSRESVDLATGELVENRAANYRTWSASRGWGMTMAEARAVSYAFCLQRDLERALLPAGDVPVPLPEMALGPP